MNLHALTNWVSETPVLPDPDLVTPTWVGFLATFFLAVVVALLIFDLARRVRRTTYRAQVAEKLDAEQRAIEAAATEVSGTGASASDTAATEAAPEKPAQP